MGGQIGAKSWIFQTELGPIFPLQDVINVMLFSTRYRPIALSNNRQHHECTFSRVKNTKHRSSGSRPPKLFLGVGVGVGGPNDTLVGYLPSSNIGGASPPPGPCSDTPDRVVLGPAELHWFHL